MATLDFHGQKQLKKTFPETESLDENLPLKVGTFLRQAIDSTFAPSASIMVCASAVDAMLKEKGYKQGGLYARINQAVEAGLLTEEMGKWAHQVRLEANDQRHADDTAELPTVEDAKQSIEFAKTLVEFLFVLPAKVSRGIASTIHEKPTASNKQPPDLQSGEPYPAKGLTPGIQH